MRRYAIGALGLLVVTGTIAARATSTQKSSPSKAPSEILDINQASAEDFARLPGIGPKLARRIVDFRQKHGPFRRVEDLMAIRGVALKKWKAIRPYVKVGSQNSGGRSQKKEC